MLVGLDVAAALVHVQLDVEIAVVLEREEVVRTVDDARAARRVDVGRRDRAGFGLRDVQHGVFDVVRQDQRQRLEVADDLVDVFDDARDRLVLVHDAVDAEPPHRRAAQRREQHAAHRVAERVAEAALERLEAEFGDVGVVFALGRFDQLRADESAQINRVCHCCDYSSGLAGVPGIALPRP